MKVVLRLLRSVLTTAFFSSGAGKTTTIGMLTGALAPTEGYAKIAGKDIRTEMNAIRQDIGICLQHDCLFPQLTVREHVQFFSRLKGLYKDVSHAEAEEQVDQAIRDVALFEKRNTLSKNLSGGMKRKLSVAMAFCGGSKVVLLDEPTSGMDPFARRCKNILGGRKVSWMLYIIVLILTFLFPPTQLLGMLSDSIAATVASF
jgi:ABC-type Na+ transport system ATPase subunit NatA